jgi:hypothetical protein
LDQSRIALLKTYLKKLATLAGVGAILMYGSEMLFWSVPSVDLSVLDLLFTWLAYTLCAYAFLTLMLVFKVAHWRGIFVCGAIFGWLNEGVVSDTMYQNFPVQLAWTALAWHALIVALLIFWLSRITVAWRLQSQIALCALLGLGFGVWAMWWPLERQPMPGIIASQAYLTGLAFVPIGSQLTINRWGFTLLSCSRLEQILLAALFGGLWIIRAGLLLQWTVLSFPVLIGVALWMLRNQPEGKPMLEKWVATQAHPTRHILFMIVPITATIVMWTTWYMSFTPPTNIPIYILTITISVLLYFDCLRRTVTFWQAKAR